MMVLVSGCSGTRNVLGVGGGGAVEKMGGFVSQTQELLTKICTICVEIHNIKGTSQKQYIKTPFKGQDKDNP